MAERVDRLIEHCTSRFFATSASGTDDEAPVLIVGMPRSGTTLVEQIISSHPLVGAGGELGFWVKAGNEWDRSEEWAQSVETSRPDWQQTTAPVSAGIVPTAARVTDKQSHNRMDWSHPGGLPTVRASFIVDDLLDTCLSIYCTPFVTDITKATRQIWRFSTASMHV